MNPNPPAGSFGGELGVVGLFDLGQLLMLNGATGCLVVHSGAKRGFLYFDRGRLVNAVDDASAQGESAAYQIFAWRSGAFQFRPEPRSGSASIQSATEAVMLEAARRMDEAASAAGAPGAVRVTERLSERQASLEALRDVFRRVTTGAGAPAAAAAGSVPELSVHLYALERPGDRLVCRRGHPARLRQRGQWREASGPTLTAETYGQIRSWLVDACRPATDPAGAPTAPDGTATPAPADEAQRREARPVRRALELADGRVIALDIVNRGADETLWLRPVGLPAPDPSRLRGSLDQLEQVIGLSHGLVMVGGPDLDSAREMLNALVAELLEDCPESLLLASNDWTYEHREPNGVLLKSVPERLRRALRMLQPDIVALDPGVGRDAVSLDDLELVPRVIAGVVVSDPASLVPRWLKRVGEGDLDQAQMSLATTPIGLVMAYPGPPGEDTLAFNAWILSERERTLALRGETGTLSPILHQSMVREQRPGRRKAA